MQRKFKRKNLLKKRKEAERALSERAALFGELPEYCLTCGKPFDKKNKEQVMSWSVVVREDEKVVRLYCPTCWDKAMSLVNEIQEKVE